MREIPQGNDLEDLIIECAQIVARDKRLCKSMLRRDEIAYDDPMEARDIQAMLNWESYDYRKKIGFEGAPYGPVIGPLKLAQDVVHAMLTGEIEDLTSDEMQRFIRQQLQEYPSFYLRG
ncbi:hypothetical protein [Labrenzia sp. DG1229]|uniref:hypothetical protein n=1 Tax=Labrenzia sp. DG1229 TaxID=681847 RepID=UPI00048C1621|nr:hypothetical protein [Labrenzia sp. DG1229]